MRHKEEPNSHKYLGQFTRPQLRFLYYTDINFELIVSETSFECGLVYFVQRSAFIDECNNQNIEFGSLVRIALCFLSISALVIISLISFMLSMNYISLCRHLGTQLFGNAKNRHGCRDLGVDSISIFTYNRVLSTKSNQILIRFVITMSCKVFRHIFHMIYSH